MPQLGHAARQEAGKPLAQAREHSAVSKALAAATAVAGLAGPFVLNSGGTPPMLALLAVIVALTLLLPLWLVLDTNYTLTADDLLIRSGPFRWRIVLGDVREVSPSHSWISSPALSLDRLSIRYGADRSILVSPREKQRFKIGR